MDRITRFFAAVQNVCLWHKADIIAVVNHVWLFGGKAEIGRMRFNIRL
jgi:hypothetical protein